MENPQPVSKNMNSISVQAPIGTNIDMKITHLSENGVFNLKDLPQQKL